MALIPEHIIEQVREANDIVDVIADYVQLKRSGRNFFGRCPFHDEKTPSFSVSPDKQIYHCFGCGAGGNVINFIMEHERLDFISSIKLLAERANIPIEISQQEQRSGDEQAQYYNMHEIAARVFESTLASESGKAARTYLSERGFSEETLKKFRVGFAPDRWDAVTLEIMKLGLSPEVLNRSGLLMSKSGGGYYDRFRSRIMFPIQGIHGKVLAFGGRIFGEDEGAKYMNSPETPIYHKGRMLYGLNLSKEEMRKSRTAIIVEGYLDLIRLYQEGFTNVVAGTGTAFTPEQAGIIKRFADKALICYDSDDAGMKAAQRAGLVLSDKGLDVSIVRLPAGEDPDSFFNSHRGQDFTRALEQAQDYVPFVLEVNAPRLQSPANRAAFLEAMVRELAQLSNQILREMLARQFADELKVAERSVMNLLRKYSRRPSAARSQSPASKPRTPDSRHVSAADRAEMELLRLHLSTNKDVLDWLLTSLPDTELHGLHYTEIFQMLRGRLHQGFPIDRARLLDEIKSREIRHLLTRLIHETDENLESVPHARQCVNTVKRHRIRKELDALREQLREEEKSGADVEPILREIQKLKSIQTNL